MSLCFLKPEKQNWNKPKTIVFIKTATFCFSLIFRPFPLVVPTERHFLNNQPTCFYSWHPLGSINFHVPWRHLIRYWFLQWFTAFYNIYHLQTGSGKANLLIPRYVLNLSIFWKQTYQCNTKFIFIQTSKMNCRKQKTPPFALNRTEFQNLLFDKFVFCFVRLMENRP